MRARLSAVVSVAHSKVRFRSPFPQPRHAVATLIAAIHRAAVARSRCLSRCCRVAWEGLSEVVIRQWMDFQEDVCSVAGIFFTYSKVGGCCKIIWW